MVLLRSWIELTPNYFSEKPILAFYEKINKPVQLPFGRRFVPPKKYPREGFGNGNQSKYSMLAFLWVLTSY
jgi:hypothetical protein